MSIVSSLKKRKNASQNIKDQIDKLNAKKVGVQDTRIWKPKVSESGVATFLVRFLPTIKEDQSPVVKRFEHFVKGRNGVFSFVCPTTFGKDCPVCESNRDMWADESTQPVARERKRREKYFANILILEDKLTPENEGKVFVYEFGAQIFGKIQEMYSPKYEDQLPIDPFDIFEGASFRIRANNTKRSIGKTKLMDYDESAFLPVSPLLKGDEKKLEDVMGKIYDLDEFTGRKELLTYEEIMEKFTRVTGLRSSGSVATTNEGRKAPARREDDHSEDQEEDEEEISAESPEDLDEDALLDSLES